MPYIKQIKRLEIDADLSSLLSTKPGEAFPLETSVGNLNYAITKIIHHALHVHGESYSAYNALIGVLECAKLELYRRRVAAYEDLKIQENGDVF